MNRNVILLTIMFFGLALLARAQRQDDAVEVRIDHLEPTPIGVSLTLRAADSHDSIHMMIGLPEGQSILRAMHRQPSDRPLSHDLFKSFLDRNGWKVKKVVIRDLKAGTFFADLALENDHESQVYDARPSDAMAIGIRFGAKIYVNSNVFEEQKKREGGDKDQEKEEKSDQPEQLKL